MRSLWLPLILTSLTLSAAEFATFDSGGKLTSLIHEGEEIEIRAGWMARFSTDLEVEMQPHDQRSPVSREGLDLEWTGTSQFPNGRTIDFQISWDPAESHTRFSSRLEHDPDGWHQLVTESVDFVVDVPRAYFAGGSLQPVGASLPGPKPADPVFFDSVVDEVTLVDANGNWRFTISFPEARQITITDDWQVDGWGNDERIFRIRIPVAGGLWVAGAMEALEGTLALEGTPQPSPVALAVDAHNVRYAFDGYGGNFCWGWAEGPEVTDYMIEHLDLAWSRSELKLVPWDLERPHPGEELVEDFERIERIQKMGIPWIISGWRLPERFFEDPDQSPPGTFGREIAAERWPELLELIGSYLIHLKENYGAEPDMLSFNEPDLGVYVGATPETHRDAIIQIGSHLEKLGFKTKMLLGDTANPRDQHQYLLPTIRDPEAMKYVAAISFHSWFGATPEQYQAWAEISRWIEKPLLIGEAGYDPGSYRNRDYDSFENGLDEARENMRILRYAEPASSLFWQLTDDYGLARRSADGTVEPTGRFWLMKHFTNLTPHDSEAVFTASDQEDVHIAAFRKGNIQVVHVLNLGAARDASFTGLASGQWQRVATTADAGFVVTDAFAVGAADHADLVLPARSLTTLLLNVEPVEGN